MKIKDQFRFILQNMKKNKIRVFMTVLATAMGCAFLIVLASVAFGLHDSIVSDTLEKRTINEIEVVGSEEGQGITDQDIAKFEELEGVRAVTRQKFVQQDAVYSIDGFEANAPTVAAHFPSEIASGVELAEGRLPEAPDEVVIGHHFIPLLTPSEGNPDELYNEDGLIKKELQFDENVIGQTIAMEIAKTDGDEETAEEFDVKIVGVMKAPGREWEWDQRVYITDNMLNELEAFTGTPGAALEDPSTYEDVTAEEIPYDQVTVIASDLESVKNVSEQLESQNYMSYSIVNEMEQMNTLFTIAKAGLIFIGTIAILIASIGIYNTMTMAVTERAPDIGIMKAIGASPKVIKRIFLLESSYIGLIGAAIGIAAAYVISILVNLGLPLLLETAFNEEMPEGLQFSSIPSLLIVIAVVICLVVTILSGLRPAKRATEIDVLKAMRREI
ncbi:ABC transporter permease [Jeotgalibacillus proteolyticus]|uniref:ABC transporter permease n=1 Tax=Jeotgalibacillus proteolyticus TaxID=2082395 RepID=UPI003CF42F0F